MLQNDLDLVTASYIHVHSTHHRSLRCCTSPPCFTYLQLPLTRPITQNRGIGHAICTSLLSTQRPTVLYAASRQGNATGLSAPSGSRVIYPRLDITDESSVHSLVKKVKEEQGGLDVLVNNAGINLDVKSYNAVNARRVMDTNYRGTLRVSRSKN
jgi:NAD(P)-dependent dehydrogenase (short-subunit alcohol dehydrogenase family)